jgi:hypothetical protein
MAECGFRGFLKCSDLFPPLEGRGLSVVRFDLEDF